MIDMYTVIRFVAGQACSAEQLDRIGALLNGSVNGAYRRPDRIGGRFSVSVSTADSWTDHELAVSSFIRSAGTAILEAKSNDISVEVDVAVEPEDINGKAYLSLSMSVPFQEEMVRNGIVMGFTFANPNP